MCVCVWREKGKRVYMHTCKMGCFLLREIYGNIVGLGCSSSVLWFVVESSLGGCSLGWDKKLYNQLRLIYAFFLYWYVYRQRSPSIRHPDRRRK